jgi:glucose/arabinose dehydrogenase
MAVRGGYLYASSDTTVYRWPYTAGQRSRITATPQVIIRNISAGGNGGAPLGHFTVRFALFPDIILTQQRTLVFGPGDFLYVSVGSLNNIDADSSRSRVRRVAFKDADIPANGFDFATMEVWADGLRNGVAMAFDSVNQLWEGDNGPDNLVRTDLAAVMVNDNPAEEINLLNGPKFYGYPYCFSLANRTATFETDPDRGKQYAWPDSGEPALSRKVNDAWCQNPQNNHPPALILPSHSSPIGMTFLRNTNCGKTTDSFSCKNQGDMFVALRGSWNAEIPKVYFYL